MLNTYILTLASAEVDLIGAALAELPLKTSLPLWMNLKNQVDLQKQNVPAPPAEVEKVPNGNDTPDNPTG